MEIIEKAYKIYETRLAVSFNGGKESTVILNMAIKMFPTIKVYFTCGDNEFPEILTFIDEICNKYKIKLLIYHDMKDAISNIKKDYNIEAILTGIRKTDNPSLEYYSMTNGDWAKIMTINPLLNWSYTDVWKYILDNNLEYCDLYDKGYTSLGNVNNTFKNFKLFNGINYDPAYKLKEESYERVGRIKTYLPKTISGKVIHGKGIAAKVLGIPTANLDCKPQIDEGVYYGTFNKYNCLISYGFNPHFGDRSFEVHVLYFNQDIYHTNIDIELKEYIRPMEKYSDINTLIENIQRDIQIIKTTKIL